MQELTIQPVEAIREHFPALRRQWNGYPVAYFDGPGGTQIARPVVDAINDYLINHNANTHWEYPSSRETDQIIADARMAYADFFNCGPDEVVFGNNMTTLTFHLAWALGRRFERGDEIVVTELDHHANSDTWRVLADTCNLNVRVLPFDTGTGKLELDKLPGLLSDRTRLVAVGAASNILGTITDVAIVCKMAREAGALSFVDAVHYAAHELIDVQAFGCDFLACSAYKFYGPHVGVLYGRKELLQTLQFPKIRPAPDTAPDRAETGTQNHEGIAGAGATVNFLASLADRGTRRERLAAVFHEFHRRQLGQVARLWEGLGAIEGVTVFGPQPGEPRTSTVSFQVAGRDSGEVARSLAERGVFVSDGDFYALTVVEKFGVGSVVRAGCACYTTNEEIDRLLEGVADAASGK